MSVSSRLSTVSSLPATQDPLSMILSKITVPAREAVSPLWFDPAQYTAKRVIDRAGAGVALLLLAPVLLAIAVVIRLTSKGPILFRQTRLGRNGEPFVLYKFRTMVVDAERRLKELEHLNESEGGVLFKIKHDPRITRIGRILRRTSLDELPQLWNILKGEMSLVGPRPLQLRDSLMLAQTDPDGYGQRLFVRPGLTGLWQARSRSETGFEHMLKLDIAYVAEWSLWLDLVIIAETAISVVRGRGAC
jgi:lipopolysaccharide/colanic/teichoic acid biosynthesis glycosyltransferase